MAECLEEMLDDSAATQWSDYTTNHSYLKPSIDVVDLFSQVNENCNGSASRKVGRRKRQRRVKRLRVVDFGYVFTYDKNSTCGTRSFWRCERKSECPARVHMDNNNNKVIKRIHEHNHEPNAKGVSKWGLCDSEPSTSVQPRHTVSDSEPSTSVQRRHTTIEVTSSKSEVPSFHENLSPSATGKDELILFDDSSLIKSDVVMEQNDDALIKCPKTEPIESSYQDIPNFWELFESTKKIASWLANGGRLRNTSTSAGDCDPEVAKFLDNYRLGDYKSLFARFPVSILAKLTEKQCVFACGNDADGILLYRAIQETFHCSDLCSMTHGSEASETVRPLRLFIANKPKKFCKSVYVQITIPNRTTVELLNAMRVKKIVDSQVDRVHIIRNDLCFIPVLVDDEVLKSVKDNTVLQASQEKDVCTLFPRTK